MIKKLVLSVLVVGLLGGLLLGRGAMSYLTTSYERASQTVEESVPLEFQIDRARKMVRDLEPEVRRSMHVIAKEEVEVESLDKRIETAETKACQRKVGDHAIAVRFEYREKRFSLCRKQLFRRGCEAGPLAAVYPLQDFRCHAGQPRRHAKRPATESRSSPRKAGGHDEFPASASGGSRKPGSQA